MRCIRRTLQTMSESVNLSNWLEPPHNRWGFHHVADLLDTVPISNESGDVTALPRESVHLDDVSFTSADGSLTTWGRHLNETFCDAICVVHKGSIVDERYFNNLTDKSQHLLMSVTKSVTAAALGISIGRGLLSINDLVTNIAPEFAGTSLEGCTIRHLIDMTAGTEFVENYDLYSDPEADNPLLEYERQSGFRPLGERATVGVLKHFATYPLARPHGELFDYRSPLTNVVARVIEIVNGMSFQEVLSRDIWTSFGMEHPATISVDPLGFPIAEAGISCTVRDLARFGLAYLNDGMLNDRHVLPESWVRHTRETDDNARACYLKSLDTSTFANEDGPDWYAYHNAFWVKERDAQFTGWGIFGQYIWVYRPSQTVIARFSTYPEATLPSLTSETLRGFNAVAHFLNNHS